MKTTEVEMLVHLVGCWYNCIEVDRQLIMSQSFPSHNLTTMENGWTWPIRRWFTYLKWSLSIAKSSYQRKFSLKVTCSLIDPIRKPYLVLAENCCLNLIGCYDMYDCYDMLWSPQFQHLLGYFVFPNLSTPFQKRMGQLGRFLSRIKGMNPMDRRRGKTVAGQQRQICICSECFL